MSQKVLIIEDEFVEANDLSLMLTRAGYSIIGIARSVQAALDIISKNKPDLALVDIFLKGKQTGIDVARTLKEEGIAFIYLSANSNEDILAAAKATEPYGFLVKPFRERDLLIALEIARYRHAHSLESRLRTEIQLKKELLAIQALGGTWNQKVIETARVLQKLIPFDCIGVKFKTLESKHFSGFAFIRIGYNEYQTVDVKGLVNISGKSLEEIKHLLAHAPADSAAGWYNGDDFQNLFAVHPMKALLAKLFGFKANLVLPFITADNYVFSLSFFSRLPEGYTSTHLDSLYRLQQPLIAVMNSIPSIDKEAALSIHYQAGHSFTAPPAKTAGGFNEIIGNSPALLNVMDLVSRVAYSETSVLLLGESGTGKEKIANSIHNLSGRSGKPFIKVNCAALPQTLIESELFGHEKGAFTGAVEKRTGRFEQANGGSIFLDEIGEMPLDLQVKLLRVLQEKEIERVGGRAPVKIDVRIITATNRNLEKEVAEGRFRLDLYYRLNVFPIVLPPLRDRKEDIPGLLAHFIKHYSYKAGKKITGYSDKLLKTMMAYHWPGNIRELEHVVERSILLARGTVIDDMQTTFNQLKETAPGVSAGTIKTISENERDYIIAVLKKCNGRVWGPGAAAELLNIPPSTLKSKMIKLGIKKTFSD